MNELPFLSRLCIPRQDDAMHATKRLRFFFPLHASFTPPELCAVPPARHRTQDACPNNAYNVHPFIWETAKGSALDELRVNWWR